MMLMKTSLLSATRLLGAAALSAAYLCVLPGSVLAKDHDDDHDHDHDHDKHHKADHHDHDHDKGHDREVYLARPRSTFTLSLGDGYAGHGYYYGPANAGYYYERPEVRYFANREAAPREYYAPSQSGGHSVGAAVQQALARKGYYSGVVDGEIGPQSHRAIARYQAEHGLRPTGEISSSLTHALGLD